ncbi:hypothetical protein PInf_008332 [Phytophthora infestans]|nr:hypothetical protein PInf_008332 [Phytophthora infestans]
MKRDVVDSPASSWQSEADDDAILDSIDDVMWDDSSDGHAHVSAVNVDERKTEQMQCDPPNPSAMERRRQKNRDCMRRARQRQRDELNNMKATVARLEKQYVEMSLQSTQSAAVEREGTLVTRMTSDYSEAVDLSRRLGAENLFLKNEI